MARLTSETFLRYLAAENPYLHGWERTRLLDIANEIDPTLKSGTFEDKKNEHDCDESCSHNPTDDAVSAYRQGYKEGKEAAQEAMAADKALGALDLGAQRRAEKLGFFTDGVKFGKPIPAGLTIGQATGQVKPPAFDFTFTPPPEQAEDMRKLNEAIERQVEGELREEIERRAGARPDPGTLTVMPPEPKPVEPALPALTRRCDFPGCEFGYTYPGNNRGTDMEIRLECPQCRGTGERLTPAGLQLRRIALDAVRDAVKKRAQR